MKLEKSDLQLETIVSRIRAGELDLQPDFQRGEIWDSKRRQRLIDTVLREWYVPAIHIVIDSDGAEVVLDGQQRLAAIRDFFADKIRVNGQTEPEDARIIALDGLRYSRLPTATRRAVNRFVLPIITLSEYEPQEPNELFFRLNQSYNLTPPEKRNALHGQARDQVKQLVVELMSGHFLTPRTIGFSNGRLAYDDIVARTCVAVERGNLRQHINNDVVEEFYRTRPFSSETINAVRDSAALLMLQIEAAGSRVKFNKGTLQTWLTYCHWAPALTGPLPSELLARFESDRSLVKRGAPLADGPARHALGNVLRLYDDRASYRVTDVSSVLTRDLAIHIYSHAVFDTTAVHGADALLGAMEDDSEAATASFNEYLDSAQWGSSMPRAKAQL